MDNRFQQMDTGQFLSATVYVPAGADGELAPTHKGLCIRVGDRDQGAICYDTELLRVSAGWLGPFLQIDPARYGLIVPPRVAGEVQFTTPAMPGWAGEAGWEDRRPDRPYGPLPREDGRYDGLYLHGRRVVLAATIRGTRVLESPWCESVAGEEFITRTLEIAPGDEPLVMAVCGSEALAALVGSVESASGRDFRVSFAHDGPTTLTVPPRRSTVRLKVALASRRRTTPERLAEQVRHMAPPEALETWTRPGPTRWNAGLATRGVLDTRPGPWALDTLSLPFDNPYGALFFVSGHDFLPGGEAAVCTVHGDVWLVSGIDDRLQRLVWKRFATGLFQPLGLKVVGDQIYVVGRDQITRLHDRNRDGEADFYENFNHDGHVSANGHEYVTCLETDSRGNFYYLKGDSGGKTRHDGCLLRVSPDGTRLDVFATGIRNANGMSIGPHDEITVAPQEGEWTPASGIFLARKDGFLGAMQVHHRAEPPEDYDRPICWLPRRIDNSSGGQAWIPAQRWGPLSGQLIHFSYGQCTMMLVLQESVEGQPQGAAVPLPLRFESGAMRGRFRPQDGHLYVSGLHGWVSNSVRDGCLQRVRYRGGALSLPVGLRTYANGMAITFSEPLDRDAAEDPDNYQLEQWNYRWSADYGSPELRPSQPHAEGRDPVDVESASLLPDGRTVFLEISRLQPVSQLAIRCQVTAAGQPPVSRELYATIHRVPAEAMDWSGMRRRRSASQLTKEERDRLTPGVRLLFGQASADGRMTWEGLSHRLAAFALPEAGRGATSWLAPGPYAVRLEGVVRVTEPGIYRVRATGTGRAAVYLNDQLVDGHQPGSGGEKELRGYIRLRVEYTPPPLGEPAVFRLLWTPPGRAEEPIPPHLLWSLRDADGRDIRTGSDATHLVQRYRCVLCHALPPEFGTAVREGTADGPSLAEVGSRLSQEWVVRWLLAPHQVRSDVSMPMLLGDPAGDEARQRAAHLAAFLASRRGPRRAGPDRAPPSGSPAAESAEAEVGRGEVLWEQLGCVACHRLSAPSDADQFQRVSLHDVNLKFVPGGLHAFLMNPHGAYPGSRMPDFHLTTGEAGALAAFLRARTPSAWPDQVPIPKGNVEQGRELALQLRCLHCHEMGAELPRTALSSVGPLVSLSDAAGENPSPETRDRDQGCLAVPIPAAASPQYVLGRWERDVLTQVLRDHRRLSRRLSPMEDAASQWTALRCHACHARDHRSSDLPTIVADEGNLGVPAEPVPGLTWAGERFHAGWMEAFIAGRLPYRPRPHLNLRMPAFPAHARSLARGFAAQHGVPPGDEVSERRRDAPAAGDSPANVLSIGYELTRKDRGLDCRQCHGVGHQEPAGDQRTRIALGINFVHAGERLRPDFYRRFVLDPPRYEPSTRMPKLSDGTSTPVTQWFDGDAARQFDAIWRYIQTLGDDEP